MIVYAKSAKFSRFLPWYTPLYLIFCTYIWFAWKRFAHFSLENVSAEHRSGSSEFHLGNLWYWRGKMQALEKLWCFFASTLERMLTRLYICMVWEFGYMESWKCVLFFIKNATQPFEDNREIDRPIFCLRSRCIALCVCRVFCYTWNALSRV